MNKQLAVALLVAVVVTGCTLGPDITRMGRDTYMVSTSGYAVTQAAGPTSQSGYSEVEGRADTQATEFCANLHQAMHIVQTQGEAEIQDPQGGLFAGGVSGYIDVKVVFQCVPVKGAPKAAP